MKYFYSLRIYVENEEQFNKLEELFSYKSISKEKLWQYEVIVDEGDPPIDFINMFLDMLENRMEELIALGITKDEITVWMLYEYDEQCNMEFSPIETIRLGEAGIKLCVSCWQKEKEELE